MDTVEVHFRSQDRRSISPSYLASIREKTSPERVIFNPLLIFINLLSPKFRNMHCRFFSEQSAGGELSPSHTYVQQNSLVNIDHKNIRQNHLCVHFYCQLKSRTWTFAFIQLHMSRGNSRPVATAFPVLSKLPVANTHIYQNKHFVATSAAMAQW